MARPKMIEDDVLLKLIKRFFDDECNGNAQKLNYETVAEYIRNQGYPDYKATTIRRTDSAREYIDSLKTSSTEKGITTIIAYKTLDVDAFLETNKSKDSLKKALITLDNHYRTMYDSASEIIKKNNKQTEQYNKATESLNSAQNQINELEAIVSTLKAEIKELKANNKTLKDIVETYVYPEIANELLSRDSVIYKEQSTIDGEVLDTKLIDASTTIKNDGESNVIKGLFNKLED